MLHCATRIERIELSHQLLVKWLFRLLFDPFPTRIYEKYLSAEIECFNPLETSGYGCNDQCPSGHLFMI